MPSKFNILFVLFCKILISPSTQNPVKDDLRSLKLVQIVFRHGDRLPDTTFLTGVGGLTDFGKQQMYNLGLEIRQRYDGIAIQTKFDSSETFIQSSDKDRTIDSASLFAHGLYRDFNLAAKWNREQILFEPIPVHTLPKEYDRILQVSSNCPNRDNIFSANSIKLGEIYERDYPEMLALYRKYAPRDFKSLKRETTWFTQFVLEQEGLLYNQSHNLPLEPWASSLVENDAYVGMKATLNRINMKNIDFQKLYPGSLVATLRENIELTLSGKNSKKFIAFSGHDRNLICLLIALNLDDPSVVEMPPNGATLMIELHETNGHDPFLKFWYKNETTRGPFALEMANCRNHCSYKKFKKLTENLLPDNYEERCKIKNLNTAPIKINIDEPRGLNVVGLSGIIIGGGVLILIVLTISLYVKRRRNYIKL